MQKTSLLCVANFNRYPYTANYFSKFLAVSCHGHFPAYKFLHAIRDPIVSDGILRGGDGDFISLKLLAILIRSNSLIIRFIKRI